MDEVLVEANHVLHIETINKFLITWLSFLDHFYAGWWSDFQQGLVGRPKVHYSCRMGVWDHCACIQAIFHHEVLRLSNMYQWLDSVHGQKRLDTFLWVHNCAFALCEIRIPIFHNVVLFLWQWRVWKSCTEVPQGRLEFSRLLVDVPVAASLSSHSNPMP